MRTIAVMNQKGGSGKTTTAVNLAAALVEKRKRVLLVDLDAQASASSWMGCAHGDKNLFSVFTDNGNLSDHISQSTVPGIDVIASSTWLVGVERALAGEVGAELVFRRAVDRLPQDRWDFLIVDCPPSLGLLSISALSACSEVIVPVETQVMAMAGLAALLQTVDRVRERLNPQLAITAILPCRVDIRKNLSRDVIARLRERFGDLVLKSMVRENVRLAEAPSFARPITLYDTRCTGAEDYRAVAAELLKRRGGRN